MSLKQETLAILDFKIQNNVIYAHFQERKVHFLGQYPVLYFIQKDDFVIANVIFDNVSELE